MFPACPDLLSELRTSHTKLIDARGLLGVLQTDQGASFFHFFFVLLMTSCIYVGLENLVGIFRDPT